MWAPWFIVDMLYFIVKVILDRFNDKNTIKYTFSLGFSFSVFKYEKASILPKINIELLWLHSFEIQMVLFVK